MARKEFSYLGKTLEELKSMPMDELIKILPARARRSLKRGLDATHRGFMLEVKQASKQLEKGETPKPIRTQIRDIHVLPVMVGLTIAVYNGKEYQNVEIQPEMIGHYLGEYALTRKSIKHSAPGVGATRSSMFVPIR